jgi:hypothetical protein
MLWYLISIASQIIGECCNILCEREKKVIKVLEE